MDFKFEPGKKLLDLIEASYLKGETATILHVFPRDRDTEIGRLVLSKHSSTQIGNITPSLCQKLAEYLDKEREAISHKRVTEFQLNQGNSTYHIITEVLRAPTSLYIFGAGHVGQAVAMVSALAGYRVVVIDDRREFLTPERFPNPGIELLEETYDQIGDKIRIPENSAVVIVTRGHQYDEVCLRQTLVMNTRYIGMIGSRRRVIAIFQRLVKEGINERLLDKVHAPIGLRIGAVSPQEIAIAIMAEIIDVMNNSKTS